ncbi:MAG: hypothetical protein AB1401_11940 [Thermodesulfobacteriota bacterium]
MTVFRYQITVVNKGFPPWSLDHFPPLADLNPQAIGFSPDYTGVVDIIRCERTDWII